MTSLTFAALVVAAGAGTRFGADQPKALLPLAGRPLVHWAVASMLEAGAATVVVVVPVSHRADFAAALSDFSQVQFADGGTERTDSVRNGLAVLRSGQPQPDAVLIHDAARPLVPREVTDGVLAALAGGATAVVPATPVTDTIRQVTDAGSQMLDRTRLRAVQTPQGFQTAALLRSYDELGSEVVTDDAGVCERAGHQVVIVPGSTRSFKITYGDDLDRAERLAQTITMESGGRA